MSKTQEPEPAKEIKAEVVKVEALTDAEIEEMRGKFLPEMVRFLLDPASQLDESVDKAIDEVLKDRKRRTQVFLTAMARKNVERIIYTVQQLPGVEKELYNPKRLHVAKTGDLIRLMVAMNDQVNKASDFLRAFVSPAELQAEPLPSTGSGALAAVQPQPPAEAGEQPVDPKEKEAQEAKLAAEQLPKESRQRMSRLLRRVVQALADADAKALEPKAVEPEKG